MSTPRLGLLQFHEYYSERIWGGQKLRTLYGMAAPADRPVGEAWLVSDHSVHESVVASGPHEGKTLRALLLEDAGSILGTRVELTPHGRFPLLLKILDAADVLSVQVHPDDACARRLGEPDVGKTEMWHVLQADPGAILICGLTEAARKDDCAARIADGSVESLMTRHDAPEGESLFVPAGTIHAIGAGLVLAEIQQNSDLTYRLYDWGRVDSNGRARDLHVEKALEATHFPSRPTALSTPLALPLAAGTREVLAACRYFAAERLTFKGTVTCGPSPGTFHILLGVRGEMKVACDGGELPLAPGRALLVPASCSELMISGEGRLLDYYVPDLARDIIDPLQRQGYPMPSIQALGDLNT